MSDCMDLSKKQLILKYLASRDNILLKIAVTNNSVNVLEYLLDNGIDPGAANHFAIKVGSARVTKFCWIVVKIPVLTMIMLFVMLVTISWMVEVNL